MENQNNNLKKINKLQTSAWTRMVVVGEKVSEDQAKNIILRTERFLTDPYFENPDRRLDRYYKNKSQLGRVDTYYNKRFQAHMKNKLGTLDTLYVNNCWSTNEVDRLGGWCHMDGNIHYDGVIGIWAAACDILEDWEQIAEAFPYLVLTAVLYDDEDKPQIKIDLRDGEVRVSLQPEDINCNLKMEEDGLNIEWVDGFAEVVSEAVSEYEIMFPKEFKPKAPKNDSFWLDAKEAKSRK